MSLELLTIVIPTRDRPDLLQKCLRSVFEDQSALPNVIVSDNSTSDQPGIKSLETKYQFNYVRQSGNLSQVTHFNKCLELPATRWVLLLHDDDELCPDAIKKLAPFLMRCGEAGIVLAGIQQIDQQGRLRGEWKPNIEGTFTGDTGLLRLGLDGCAYPPGTIFNVAAARQIGGFRGIDGVACDHLFALQLAYQYGVAFLPELVGRYRSGPQQIFHISNPEQAACWLDFELQEAELIRTLGCSSDVSERLIDYRTWWIFLLAAPSLQNDPSLAWRVVRKCLGVSPRPGEWQDHVRDQYPFLFSRARWLAWYLRSLPVFKTAKAVLPLTLRRWVREVISR